MLDSLFSIFVLVGGTVLAFQFVLMLLGLGGDDGVSGSAADGAIDGEVPLHGEVAAGDAGHFDAHWFYEMLSLRSLSAAATFFGLVGKTALAYGSSPGMSLLFATMAGAGAMYGVYWLFKQVYRLQNSGNENVRRAIGLPATVYVPIPAASAGAGKVTFRLQDRTVEYLAVTDEADRLATGEKVVIVGIVNSGTVRVERQLQPALAETVG